MNQVLDDPVKAAENPGIRREDTKVSARNVDVFYGDKQALFGVDLEILENRVTALIGPSGCGKSTFLRCINRMNDVIEGCTVSGEITMDGHDIYDTSLDVVLQPRRDVATVNLSLDSNDVYRIDVRGKKRTATFEVGPYKGKKGFKGMANFTHRLDKPVVNVATVRITPVRGDKRYSFGHVKLIAPSKGKGKGAGKRKRKRKR